MIDIDNIVNNSNKGHNENWPYIPDHPYRILIIGGSGSGKTNTLLNLINEQRDIDKIYLYAKDLSESVYEHLIKNRANAGIKHLNDSKAFIECSNTMDDVSENIDDYNPNRKRKVLTVFDGFFFFPIRVFFHEHSQSTGQQGKGEGIYLTPLYHFHPLHRHLDISRAITAESSPLHIAGSRTRTGNLWFPSASR